MNLKMYQVDAFTDKLFAGNPAAVCPLDYWLPDNTLQSIAMENNLAETAFYVLEKDSYRIRWFTPTVEVDLCGHATLATAFVLFHHENYTADKIVFNSRSGPLTVTKKDSLLSLNFPVDTLTEVDSIATLEQALGTPSIKTYKGKTDYMLVFENETQIKRMVPDFKLLATVKARGVVVTAKGDSTDFVSRFFGPQSGIDEDPVTGSAHTSLTPYWSNILKKKDLTALQLSPRGGKLWCTLAEDRVIISGTAKLYLTGTIYLD
jgi:PhzF family phenazine biosynthesis protein